jgi:hypothetical protein
MVWLVVALPAAAVVAGLLTLWLAARAPDPLIDRGLQRENLVWKAPATTGHAASLAPGATAAERMLVPSGATLPGPGDSARPALGTATGEATAATGAADAAPHSAVASGNASRRRALPPAPASGSAASAAMDVDVAGPHRDDPPP